MNVSQLSTTASSLSTGLGAATSSIGSLSTSTSTTLSTAVNGVGSLSTGLSTTNGNLGSLSTSVSSIYNTGTKYFHANSTGADSQAIGADSVAIGQGATSNGADSVAIGRGAQTHMPNSVALGAGSVANVGALTSYAAFALAGGQSSKGEVNVGGRQITGVAPGSADQDAINVLQVKTITESLSDDLKKIDKKVNALPQPPSGLAAPLAAFAPRSAIGLAPIGGGAGAPDSNALAVGADARAGIDGTAIGLGAVVQQSGGVALGSGSVASTAAGAAGYVPPSATSDQAAAVKATTSTQAAVSVGDAANGQYRQITGVAAGSVDSDAANIAQLKAASNAVKAGSAQYDTNPDGTVNYGRMTLGNGQAPQGTRISNVAPGLLPNDAVNVSQLQGVQGQVRDVARIAYSGVAMATAMSSIAAGHDAGQEPGLRRHRQLFRVQRHRLRLLAALGKQQVDLQGQRRRQRHQIQPRAGAGYEW